MANKNIDITPGTPSNKEEERNQALIADYIKHSLKDGRAIYKFKTFELVAKYQISQSRIYKILGTYGVPRRRT